MVRYIKIEPDNYSVLFVLSVVRHYVPPPVGEREVPMATGDKPEDCDPGEKGCANLCIIQ